MQLSASKSSPNFWIRALMERGITTTNILVVLNGETITGAVEANDSEGWVDVVLPPTPDDSCDRIERRTGIVEFWVGTRRLQ